MASALCSVKRIKLKKTIKIRFTVLPLRRKKQFSEVNGLLYIPVCMPSVHDTARKRIKSVVKGAQ